MSRLVEILSNPEIYTLLSNLENQHPFHTQEMDPNTRIKNNIIRRALFRWKEATANLLDTLNKIHADEKDIPVIPVFRIYWNKDVFLQEYNSVEVVWKNINSTKQAANCYWAEANHHEDYPGLDLLVVNLLTGKEELCKWEDNDL